MIEFPKILFVLFQEIPHLNFLVLIGILEFDKYSIDYAMKRGLKKIFLSFTSSSKDIEQLRLLAPNTKIIAKIERKSIPRDASGTQNRLKIASGTLSGHPVASKSVPKASRERLGSVPERPRRAAGASGGSPRVPRDARKGALERLGARRGDQNRRQVASGNKKFELSWHGSLADRFSVDFRGDFR